jgi:hypothetical protein
VDTWLAGTNVAITTSEGVMHAECYLFETTCYGCGATLTPVFNHPKASVEQMDNALVVQLSGGYGMFVESIPEGPPKVTICHECAHRACSVLPWLNALIQPDTSHTHTAKYTAEHPEHKHGTEGT